MVKEHFLGFVAETFPDLLPRYERAYTGTTISSDYQRVMERRIATIRARHDFIQDAMQDRRVDSAPSVRIVGPVLPKPGQLALPL